MDIGGQIAFIQEGIDCFGPSPGAEAILATLRLVPKLLQVVEAARKALSEPLCTFDEVDPKSCTLSGLDGLQAALAALDAGEGV